MIRVYISYATEDKSYGEHLKRLLEPFTASLGFTVWSVQDTRAGLPLQREMASHLCEASLFVPLLSADFCASKRCQVEMTDAFRLQSQGLHIVGVYVRSVYFGSSPLGRISCFPASGKPLVEWSKRDKVWAEVQQGILTMIGTCS